MLAVVNAWATASYRLSPAIISATATAAVMPTYSAHSRRAVELTRGARRSEVGPGASAVMRLSPPTPKNGRMVTARTTMPMPPYHWMIWRHMSTPRPTSSMGLSTVDPVAE